MKALEALPFPLAQPPQTALQALPGSVESRCSQGLFTSVGLGSKFVFKPEPRVAALNAGGGKGLAPSRHRSGRASGTIALW